MNYGPLEFADYLRRRAHPESATVEAARAAAPGAAPGKGLSVVSGPGSLPAPALGSALEAGRVHEAVTPTPLGESREPGNSG